MVFVKPVHIVLNLKQIYLLLSLDIFLLTITVSLSISVTFSKSATYDWKDIYAKQLQFIHFG